MKLVFFDLETTGTNPGKHGIHQISGQIVIDGVIKETFDFHVQPNPRAMIEDEALKVGGVTREQILAYPPMQQVYQEFVAMLGKYVDKFNKKDKFFLVGYNNAAFDNQFLRGFFLQNGDVYFGSWFWSNSIDVMVLASAYLATRRPDMENFKLSTVVKTLGVNVNDESLHDAMYDIELTKAVFDIVTRNQYEN
jgi:DNA polymerase-3 subunit epsilon